jgi:serine/threonine protein kinase
MGNQLKKEISIMKMVRHRFVVGMKEVLASKTKIFIVLELITGGELFDKIVSVGKLPEETAKFYFMQLLEGVEYCHSLGVCHRDLKPENLLLDEHGNIKISDFGLSSLYVGDAEAGSASRTELLHTTCGTPNYVAPEVLADQGYDGKKADVWSLGVILYVLLAGFLPFDESTIVALFEKIQRAEFAYPSWFSAGARDMLDKILVADPKKRLSLKELKVHPWIQSVVVTQEDSDTSTPVVPALDLSHANAITPEVSANAIRDEHHDGDLSDGEDDEVDGDPVTLDAFELVAQCGGFVMNR